MGGGAAAAQDEILCFVDADSSIHPQTIAAVAAAMERPDIGGGATGVVPERWSAPLRMLSAMKLPARLMGIDSSVAFCRRADFITAGGYRSDLLVGEDVEFLWRLKLGVRRQSRDLVRLNGVEAITSTRKLDRYGHWRFRAALFGLAVHRLVSPTAGLPRS